MSKGLLRRNRRSVVAAFVFSLLVSSLGGLGSEAVAESAEVVYHFEKGNEYYKNGQYSEAIREYEQVLELGYESPELYYNLGNCYYRLQQIGKAILYLERARKLAPHDEDVVHNLQIARLRVADKVPEIPKIFVQRWLESIRERLSVDGWALLLLAVYGATMVALIVRVVTRKRSVQVLFGRLGAVLGVLTLVVALFWVSALRAEKQVYAVILAEKVDVRSAPESGATEVFSLHEGFRVQVRKRVGDWCEIRLPDGKVGWVQAEALEVI